MQQLPGMLREENFSFVDEFESHRYFIRGNMDSSLASLTLTLDTEGKLMGSGRDVPNVNTRASRSFSAAASAANAAMELWNAAATPIHAISMRQSALQMQTKSELELRCLVGVIRMHSRVASYAALTVSSKETPAAIQYK